MSTPTFTSIDKMNFGLGDRECAITETNLKATSYVIFTSSIMAQNSTRISNMSTTIKNTYQYL